MKPYTEGSNLVEVIRSMEAYTYIDETNPLLSNVSNTVIRGINELKTAFTETVTQQPVQRQVPTAQIPTTPDLAAAIPDDPSKRPNPTVVDAQMALMQAKAFFTGQSDVVKQADAVMRTYGYTLLRDQADEIDSEVKNELDKAQS